MHLARPEAELEVREPQDVRGLVPARHAPQQRAQPGEELGQGERLREVVVCPGIEACNSIVHLRASGQHEDRDRVVVRSEPSADFEPVDPGHEHVQDHGVRSCQAYDPPERLLSVLGEVDLIPLELERTTERLANGSLVVDHEDLHCSRIVRIRVVRSLAS